MTKFDFSEEIKDLFGNVHFNTSTMHKLVEPQKLKYYDDNEIVEKKVQFVAPHEKPLTYQKAIFNALRNAGNSQNNRDIKESFDKDEMGMLMIKLSADTDVELSVDDRVNIKKACKVFSDTEVYIQVKQKLFPEGVEKAKEEKQASDDQGGE